MRSKKRPLSERTTAVGIALVNGAQAASDATGIPRPTIIGWMKRPEYDELRQKTPDMVLEQLWTAVQIGIDQVAIGLTEDAPLRDKAIALGILYDKHALLGGGATARTEHRDADASPEHINAAIDAAASTYLRVLEGAAPVGRSQGKGAASNGHAALPAALVSGEAAEGFVTEATGTEGKANGHQSNGRHRGPLES